MAVSELPGNPNAVWTVRRHVEGKYTCGQRQQQCPCVVLSEQCRLISCAPDFPQDTRAAPDSFTAALALIHSCVLSWELFHA